MYIGMSIFKVKGVVHVKHNSPRISMYKKNSKGQREDEGKKEQKDKKGSKEKIRKKKRNKTSSSHVPPEGVQNRDS